MTAFWFAILTACVWGVVPILEKMGLTKVDPFTALLIRCFGAVIGIIIMSLFVVKPEQLRAVDMKTITILVIAGFLAGFVAQFFLYQGLNTVFSLERRMFEIACGKDC